MDKIIKLKLSNLNISDLKAILEVCKENGRTSIYWKERAELVNEVLTIKINNLFTDIQ